MARYMVETHEGTPEGGVRRRGNMDAVKVDVYRRRGPDRPWGIVARDLWLQRAVVHRDMERSVNSVRKQRGEPVTEFRFVEKVSRPV